MSVRTGRTEHWAVSSVSLILGGRASPRIWNSMQWLVAGQEAPGTRLSLPLRLRFYPCMLGLHARTGSIVINGAISTAQVSVFKQKYHSLSKKLSSHHPPFFLLYQALITQCECQRLGTVMAVRVLSVVGAVFSPMTWLLVMRSQLRQVMGGWKHLYPLSHCLGPAKLFLESTSLYLCF